MYGYIEGIYKEAPYQINGKLQWTRSSGKYAIWFNDQNVCWMIGSAYDVGTDICWIYSTKIDDGNMPYDVTEWKYLNENEWIPSTNVHIVQIKG